MLHAHQIAEEIASGRVSAREAVAACIERIESTHAAINAVVVPRFEQALEEAALADDARGRGDPLGPLHGVPITIKESFDLTGTATTAGLTSRVSHRAADDAWVVARLRRAGAIVLGKTNVSQLLLHDSCCNPLYGQTNNPWQLERSPGASSGGEAAILAVGGSALGIGSDIGGSVRLPADACGVNSLKPTSGRLPMDGHISFFPDREDIMCQPGPLARSVTDLTLAMRVLTDNTPRSRDNAAASPPWRNLETNELRGFRIGFHTDNGIVRPSPAIRGAVTAAARALEERGLIVEEWQPPDLNLMWRVYTALLLGDGLAKIRQLCRGSKLSRNIQQLLFLEAFPKNALSIGSRFWRVAGQPQLAESVRYWAEPSLQLFERRTQLCRTVIAAMDAARLDAILCPVFIVPALRHRMNGFINEGLSYTAVYNFLGTPAGVVAATRVAGGEESDRTARFNLVERAARQVEAGSVGLPVGVQVVSRHWREDVVLGIMSLLEEHFRRQPGYPADPPVGYSARPKPD
jgi:fatty acid amide hydrolase